MQLELGRHPVVVDHHFDGDYLLAAISSSTSRSLSLPKKISSPTKNVGEPKVPRSTERRVLASSPSLTSGVCASSNSLSAGSCDSISAARSAAASSSFLGSLH